ncbi:MAG TPA: hypothetical protein VJ809_04370, partial [Pirellulales bacterium]|nr:hypothetical protein [Pirellulales bacterium]
MKPLVLIALAAAFFNTSYSPCAAKDQPVAPTAAPTGAPTFETRPVTFNKNIAPILFRHCVECHR